MTKRPDLLSRLILLRHDPELVEELRAEAMLGDSDAQYGLGLVYAEGRGVDQDDVEAFAWLSVAMLQGDPEAENLRNVVLQTIDPKLIQEANARAGNYVVLIEQHLKHH